MDNDNLLVQKAADLYRGLRFKMKYRGVPILFIQYKCIFKYHHNMFQFSAKI